MSRVGTEKFNQVSEVIRYLCGNSCLSDSVELLGKPMTGSKDEALSTDSMDVSLSELRELVMDREAWRTAIHGITKSRTRLSD